MRGISDESLKELVNSYEGAHGFSRVFKWLLKHECQELNQWMPIDENTPKDRPIILFNPEDNRGYSGQWRGTLDGSGYWDYDHDNASFDKPTHWMPLPNAPD